MFELFIEIPMEKDKWKSILPNIICASRFFLLILGFSFPCCPLSHPFLLGLRSSFPSDPTARKKPSSFIQSVSSPTAPQRQTVCFMYSFIKSIGFIRCHYLHGFRVYQHKKPFLNTGGNSASYIRFILQFLCVGFLFVFAFYSYIATESIETSFESNPCTPQHRIQTLKYIKHH